MKFKLITYVASHEPHATRPLIPGSLDLPTAKRLLHEALFSLSQEMAPNEPLETVIWAEIVVDDPKFHHQFESMATTAGAFIMRDKHIGFTPKTMHALDYFPGLTLIEIIGQWLRTPEWHQYSFQDWIVSQVGDDWFKNTTNS